MNALRADASRTRPAAEFVMVGVDEPKSGAVVQPGATLTGRGWVLSNTDLDCIQIFLGDQLCGHATYGAPRPDIAQRFPGYRQADQCGFSFSISLPPGGVAQAEALSVVVRTAAGRQTRRVVPIAAPSAPVAGQPQGADAAALWPVRLFIEQARLDDAGLLRVRGWVLSLAPLGALRMLLGTQELAAPELGLPRPDVSLAHPDYPNSTNSGFQLVQQIAGEIGPHPMLRIHAVCEGGLKRQIMAPVERHSGRRRASSLGGTQFCCDVAAIGARGQVLVSGWAVAEAGVVRVAVELDGAALGEATIGLLRPDVGNRFARIASARHSGFHFSHELGRGIAGEHTLTLKVRDSAGDEQVIPLPVQARMAASGPEASEQEGVSEQAGSEQAGSGQAGSGQAGSGQAGSGQAGSGQAGSGQAGSGQAGSGQAGSGQAGSGQAGAPGFAGTGIRFDLDQPALSGEQARDPVRTTLTVAGWAVSPGGIDHVDVTIDGESVGHAYYGVRRADVAGAFPELPEALLCGFALLIPAQTIGAGDHAVSVVIHGRDGETAERSFWVTCERSDAAPPSESIRARLGQVEIDHGLAILDRLGHACFGVHLGLDDLSPDGLALAQRTLASLQAQGYARWQAILDLPPGVAAAPVIAGLAATAGCAPEQLVAVASAPVASAPVASVADASVADASVADASVADAGPGSRALRCALRAGDRLGPDALLEFAIHAALNPRDDFIYSDDRRHNPTSGVDAAFFKPDWSPDLLLSFNYIGRAWCAAPALFAAAGLPAHALGGIGDFATVLRLTECAQSIGHLPRLLLEAAGGDTDATVEAAAVAAAVQRRGLAASVGPGRTPGSVRVARRVGAPGRVSVIIPTIAARGLIKTTLRGLRHDTAWPDLEIVCIDNIPPGQELHWKDWLRAHADTVIELAEPFNWSRFNNVGAAAATGDYLLFLNDDVEIIHPQWLEILVSHAQRPEVGIVAPQLLYPNGTVQHAGMFLTATGSRHAFRFAGRDEPGPFGLALCERNLTAVTGACMLVRRDAYQRAGGFNEAHSVVNNDVDYCLRARSAGQLVVLTPHAVLYHHELASRAAITDSYDETRFRADWGSVLLRGDPYYNRNLAQDSDMWTPEAEPTEVVYAGHPLIARPRVRRILAMKLDHIGDFLTALPALRRLKQRFPDAQLQVLCPASSKALADLEPCIDGTVEFNFFHVRSGEGERRVTTDELQALQARLAPCRFDLALDLRMHPDTRHVLRYTGAPFLAGFEHDNSFPWLDLALPWEGDAALRAKRSHVSDRLTQLAEAVSIACESERPTLRSASVADARAHVAALADMPADFFAGTVVCVHPGVGNEMRQWPARHFASLIDMLGDGLAARVMLIGAGEEADIARAVLESVARPERVLSLVGRTSLADLPSVLRASTLYVGNNSGPKHLAAALGVPTLGVHSAVVEAAEWGPVGPHAAAVRRKVHCGPCYLAFAAQCARKLACLSGLRPADVYAMCVRLLGAVDSAGGPHP